MHIAQTRRVVDVVVFFVILWVEGLADHVHAVYLVEDIEAGVVVNVKISCFSHLLQ